MKALWAKSLDRFVMHCLSPDRQYEGNVEEAEKTLREWLEQGALLEDKPGELDITFYGKQTFCFSSPVVSPWPENNLVHGRWHPVDPDRWREHPTVLLLHGWNAELAYRFHFPLLAWRLNRVGLNAAMIELPYHGKRKPRAPGALKNFISADLVRAAEAMRQGVSEIRALKQWLRSQGSPQVGGVGFSLGAWLLGLTICHEPDFGFATLVTPVVRLDQAVRELPFCRPIRSSWEKTSLPLERLNLDQASPLIPPERILLIASQYDLIAPRDTTDILAEKWGRPEVWRPNHGHVSVWLSVSTMERMVQWMRKQALSPSMRQ